MFGVTSVLVRKKNMGGAGHGWRDFTVSSVLDLSHNLLRGEIPLQFGEPECSLVPSHPVLVKCYS